MSMQAFRNSAKPIIYIVAISFFAWLVFDLSGLSGGTGVLTTTSVGKINGESVDSRLFQQAVSQATEAQQRQSAEPLGIAGQAQIRDQVWEQIIQERLLEDEYQRYGITVSSEEIAAAIRSSPPSQLLSLPDFQTDGQFDATKYERWLASEVGQAYVPVLEGEYRGQILQAKLARHLVASVYVSDAELWERFRDQKEMVTLGLVSLDPNAISDSAVTVTTAEVEQYYRARRDSLKTPATAFMSFVTLDRRPIASDTLAARERAAALRAEIIAGTPFAEVARRESSDTVSGSRGGELGEWTKGQFDPAFEQVAFSLPLKTVSDPVLSSFGYHLIEMTSRTGDKANGRHILIPIEVTGAHRDQLDARADSLESLAAARLDPAALDTAASALGLPINASGPVQKDQPSLVPPDASVWAFQAEAGEQSPVIETASALYVFRLDSLHAEGVPSLERARPEIESRLKLQKRLEELRKAAVTLAERAKADGLDNAAKALGAPYSVSGPFTRLNAPLQGGAAVGAAFGLQQGETSGVVSGRDMIYVMTALERTPADSAEFTQQLPQLRSQAVQNARALALRQYMLALRKQAKIVDERHLIYKTEAQIEAEAPVLPGQQP
jgi:peptidyl-prolyl cis-trans isomerase D